jgi:hypothetical protein
VTRAQEQSIEALCLGDGGSCEVNRGFVLVGTGWGREYLIHPDGGVSQVRPTRERWSFAELQRAVYGGDDETR